jgi:hypothetical protein
MLVLLGIPTIANKEDAATPQMDATPFNKVILTYRKIPNAHICNLQYSTSPLSRF